MLTTLYKLAYNLERQNQYALADEVDAVLKEIATRAGVKDLVALADYMDESGDTDSADFIDELLSKRSK